MRFIQLKIAWLNIWRHPLRSAVLIGAILCGMMAGVFSIAMTNGFMQQRIENMVESQYSHIQAHNPAYIDDPEIENILSVNTDIVLQLQNYPEVKSATARSKVPSMVASAGNAAGVLTIGVMPENEAAISGLNEKIIDGNYFDSDNRNDIIIGKKLSEKLNVSPGSRVVLTFTDKNNEIVSAAFRVQGIYRTFSDMYDERFVFVPLPYLNNYLGIGEGMHEVAVLLHNPEQIPIFIHTMSPYFENDTVRSWQELSPELRIYDEMGNLFSFIFIIVILLGLGFGILNTMLMSIFERTRESGMLMAIGMNRSRVFILIMVETVLLSVTGGIAGLFGGMLLIRWTGDSGIDFSMFSDALTAFGYDSVVYPYLDLSSYFVTMGLVILFAILASIYPSLKAIGLVPAEAVRR